jgi:tetratricopeptide (TPR) repeat protein
LSSLGFYENYHSLRKELYESYPDNVGFKNGLAVSYSKLGTFYRTAGNIKKAKEYYTLCGKLWSELVGVSPGNNEFQNNLNWARRKLAEIGEASGQDGATDGPQAP